MKQKHYLIVISPGPPMILRVPWPMPRWRSILRATTAVMRSHGLRQKDVYALEGVMPWPADRTDDDREIVARADAAYRGEGDKFQHFWLYDWRGDAFKLARRPTTGVAATARRKDSL
jgi:hypothetical protein